jgi:4'-phosphopantetheinyl transferase
MCASPCVVWLADLRADRPAEGLLDAVECARRDSYRLPADRLRFALGASLVRLIAASVAGIDPREVVVDRTCPRCGAPHGRPILPGLGLNVSVSHSGDLVGVAAVFDAPVGLDIEAVTATVDGDVLRLCLAEQESLSAPGDFYTYWCRKESVVKATGDGLATPLTQVVVSPADAPPRLLRYAGRTLAARLHDLPVGPGYAAALTLLTEAPVSVAIRRANELVAGLGAPLRGLVDSLR